MRRYKGHLIALAIGFILLLFSLINQMTDAVSGIKDWVRILSNSALVPGVLLTGLGLIVWISGEGFFDGIKYSMSSMITHLRKGTKRYASYYDYIRREKKTAEMGILLVPGLFYLIIAVILTGVYYLI